MSRISWGEAKSLIGFEKGFVIVMFTDKVIVAQYPLDEENEKLFSDKFEDYLLDCRVFAEEGEHRWFRGDIGKELNYRYLDDSGDYIDRSYYLDINTKISQAEQGVAYATGGGSYRLPLNNYNDAKIRIREYLKYDECGHAQIYDWRLIGFEEGR